MKKTLIFIFLLGITTIIHAQLDVSEQRVSALMFSPSYMAQLPGGDMAKQFGFNNNVGFAVGYKTVKNKLFWVEGNFLFGQNVKQENVLGDALTSYGAVIDKTGVGSRFVLNERGYQIKAKFGKIFSLKDKPNPNSGLLYEAAAGVLMHKIFIDIDDNTATQFKKDYRTGYDRKSVGPAISQFIGYQYMSNRKLLNFYFGLDITAALTKNVRNWDFVENRKISGNKLDMLFGLKFGMIVAKYKSQEVTTDTYYYK